MSDFGDRLELLHGVRVVELGGGIAGFAAASMLADLGASVDKFVFSGTGEEGAGPRRPAPEGTSTSYLSLLLDRFKTVTTLSDEHGEIDELVAMFAPPDIVLCDLIEGPFERYLDEIERYVGLVAEANEGAWVTIAPFGLDGPFRSYRGSELVCGAAGGMLASVRSEEERQPIKFAGMQSLVGTGQLGALAALHGLDLSRRNGPTHIEVSAQESVIMTGPSTHCAVALLNSTSRGGPGRVGPPFGLYPCRNGLVHINVLEDHQWQGVVKAMEFGAWADGLQSARDRMEHAAEIEERVRAWTGVRDKAECAAELQGFGVPAAPVNSPADLLEAAQFAFREFFVPADLDGTTTRVPRLPFQVLAGGTSAAGDDATDARSGLCGLRVLEFTHVIAAPFATSLVGAMGADVLRVENRQRLDVYRRSAPYADDIPGENRNCYFIVNNHSKRVLALDEDPSGEQLAELLEHTDVVVENWGRRRAGRIGVDARTLSQRPGHLLALSSSGFGSDGPMGEYRAYAYNVQAFGGLADLTRDGEGRLVNMRTAWADLSTGVVLATVIAAWALGPSRGRAMSVDLSMAEVVVARLGDYVAAAAALSSSDSCQANTVYPLSPNGVYRVGESWLALTVVDDAEWRRLLSVLGDPASLKNPHYDSAEGRWHRRATLDRLVGESLANEDAGELFARLQAAKVRACPVYEAEQLIDDPHLVERGFFVTIEHKELGSRRTVGLPWKLVGEARIPIGPSPLL